MIRTLSYLRQRLGNFAACDAGAVTVEFVIIFPMFMMFFLMTVEAGVISIRHTMLERGVDLAVREVRIGRMANPTRERLIKRICEESLILPNCESQMQLEMIIRDPRAWAAVSQEAKCVDRSVSVQPPVDFTPGGNNDLVILRACARFDPFLPFGSMALLGTSIRENASSAAGGSYALIATSAFAVEPFNKE